MKTLFLLMQYSALAYVVAGLLLSMVVLAMPGASKSTRFAVKCTLLMAFFWPLFMASGILKVRIRRVSKTDVEDGNDE